MDRTDTLPGVEGGDNVDRIICHVDMDCFYAACERLREPALVGEPVIVGMGYEPGDDGGVVATASYEARDFGIESAQPINDTLARLPRAAVMPEDYAGPVGHYRPVDMGYYQSISAAVLDVLREHAETIRVASLDEAYLDVTALTDWTDAADFGGELKEVIAERVGVPASIGIAPTLGVAKIASDHDKPDGLTVVEPGSVEAFLEPLPVGALHGVGPVTADALTDLGLETAGDVAAASPATLEEHFGERGLDLARHARGAGPSHVEPRGRPKSLSRESSLGDPPPFDTVRERVRDLARDVAARAIEQGAQYRTVGIKVVTEPFDVNTRERSFGGPFTDAALVEETAFALLEEFRDADIRKVGVRVSNLDFAADQVTLEDVGSGDGSAASIQESLRSRQGTLSDFDG